MTTNVILRRGLFEGEVQQRTDNGFFSLTDLISIGNRWRLLNGYKAVKQDSYFSLESSKMFVSELKAEFGKVKISGRGRGKHTWVHPLLFIDIALWVNPKLKVKVYKWLYDELVKYRLQSGDSYKKMCGVLWVKINRKDKFQQFIKQLAIRIKEECEVTNWELATEDQLKLRDKMHENIALIADIMTDTNQAIDIAIEKAKQ